MKFVFQQNFLEGRQRKLDGAAQKMGTLFCNVCNDFLNSQMWKEIMLELNGKLSSVTTFSTGFSFQNLVFWNLFEFSVAEVI
jgi:hypothetical protein